MASKTMWSALAYADSIRLLLLQPAKARESALHGELQLTTLSAYEQEIFDPYTAISYVWGDPEQGDQVWLGNTRVGITANLGAVLRDIRDANKTLTVWVDALCINQDEIAERNQQVQIMGEIYRQASSTIIYLGPTSQDIDLLFDTSIEHKRLDPVNYNQPAPSPDEKWTFEENPRLSKAIDDLCSREWFSRSWVFQELVLSKHPRIQCSQRRVQWDTVMALISRYADAQGHCRLALAMNRARANPNGQSFYHLLISRIHSKATDPRDFFYSVIGLAYDRQQVVRVLPVDYNIPPKDVYVRAARYLLKGSSDLARLVSHCNLSALGAGLPSWVPDWGVQTKWLLQPHNLTPNHHVNDVTARFAPECGTIEEISDNLISCDIPPSLCDHARLIKSILVERDLSEPLHTLGPILERQIHELWRLWDLFVEQNRGSNVNSFELQTQPLWPYSPALLNAADNLDNLLIIVRALCECVRRLSDHRAGYGVLRVGNVSGVPILIPFEAKVHDKIIQIDDQTVLVRPVHGVMAGSETNHVTKIEFRFMTQNENLLQWGALHEEKKQIDKWYHVKIMNIFEYTWFWEFPMIPKVVVSGEYRLVCFLIY